MDHLIFDLAHLTPQKAKDSSALVARRIFTASPEAPEITFEDMLSASIKKVNDLQLESDDKIQQLATGDAEDISEVVLASSRAEIALRLLMEIRNKFLDAYQNLSRISG